MGRRENGVARISVLVAAGKLRPLARAVRQARRAGLTAVEIQEILLQSHLFAGYPRMIEALASLEGSLGRGRTDRGDRHETRGWIAVRRVYGDRTQAMLDRMGRLHPDLPRWIVRDGYGRVFGRRWLRPRDREIAAIASLAFLGAREPLRSHLRGALRMGVPARIILASLGACRRWIGRTRLRLARELLREEAQ